MKRGIAIFTLILFCLALIALLFLAFTGGKQEYMLALLFCVMILPSLFYVYQWITRLIKKD
ncbi:phosphate ABC transporter substrate-binding protein [Oribacterium sinus]